MSYTYPPELLPVADVDDEAAVVVCGEILPNPNALNFALGQSILTPPGEPANGTFEIRRRQSAGT